MAIMKILLSWLREYIPITLTPIDIAKKLTMAGLEVDAVEPVGVSFQGIIVGKVIEASKHPNADKLCVATVFDGKDHHQVVCGAANCRQGLKTAFAPVDATLTDEEGKPFKIKKCKIRGVESNGMLCAADELGVGEGENGIIELPDNLEEGTNVADIFADWAFEISLTPNLGHCASLQGVSRELSAVTGIPFTPPSIQVKGEMGASIQSLTSVVVEDVEKCPRYTCRLIRGVKVGPSPQWLKSRLEASGIRSINNIVDITNYVLLEFGQPLHAFDFDLLEGHKVIVKCAQKGEIFTTLDGKERTLTPDMLMICDEKKSVAIAGVMGGSNSEVTEKTVNVLLEAAYFSPQAIRKTSKLLGLSTDASKRFERSCDPNGLKQAVERATQLIHELAGGEVATGLIDISQGPFPEKVVTCRLSRINQLLGSHLGVSEVETVFQHLGFAQEFDKKDLFKVSVPTYRADISSEVDLIEEVARIYGYDNIPKRTAYYESSLIPHSPIYLFEKEARTRLIAEGLQEFITCDLIGPAMLEVVRDNAMKEAALVRVKNPVSIEQSVLRYSLLPGLLQLVKYNYDRQNHDVSGFEIGRIHFRQGEQYKEQSVIGILLTGKQAPHNWNSKLQDVDFFQLKGMVENILTELGIENFHFKVSHLNTLHSGRQASILINEVPVGSIGEVHPAVIRRLDIPQRVYYAEIDLHELYPLRKQEIKMQSVPVYPGSSRDWTITLKEKMAIGELFNILHAIPSNLLEDVSLLDIYRSERLGADFKNVTLRFLYRDPAKTLSQEEVDAAHAHLTQETLNALGKATI
jgi:phenylalanyl-tRNA synthetase beta chain